MFCSESAGKTALECDIWVRETFLFIPSVHNKRFTFFLEFCFSLCCCYFFVSRKVDLQINYWKEKERKTTPVLADGIRNLFLFSPNFYPAIWFQFRTRTTFVLHNEILKKNELHYESLPSEFTWNVSVFGRFEKKKPTRFVAELLLLTFANSFCALTTLRGLFILSYASFNVLLKYKIIYFWYYFSRNSILSTVARKCTKFSAEVLFIEIRNAIQGEGIKLLDFRWKEIWNFS